MLDQFGIKVLSPTKSGGRLWTSNWNTARGWQAGGLEVRSTDPLDNQCYLLCPESYKVYDNQSPPDMTNEFPNKVNIDGAGIMTMNGPFPRLFINNDSDSWLNVEATIYVKTVEPVNNTGDSTPLILYVRTDSDNALNCPCDANGYQVRYDANGTRRIRKEMVQDYFATDVSGSTFAGSVFPATWLGVKLIVRNVGNQNVDINVMEDTTGGLNGGTWTQTIHKLDDGGWGISDTDIAQCLTNNPNCRNPTSAAEKILVNNGKSCLIGINNYVCNFKWFSLREVVSL